MPQVNSRPPRARALLGRLSDMDLRLLQVFKAVVDCGGFALTAEGQHVYDETLRLLAAVDGFRASVHDIHARMGGKLAIALFDKTASNPAARIHQAIAA